MPWARRSSSSASAPGPVVGPVREQVGHPLDEVVDDLSPVRAAAGALHVVGHAEQRTTEGVGLLLVGPVRVAEPLHDLALGDAPGVLGVDEQPVHVEQDRLQGVLERGRLAWISWH